MNVSRYVERTKFLERVDHRQFELEKAVRLTNMKQWLLLTVFFSVFISASLPLWKYVCKLYSPSLKLLSLKWSSLVSWPVVLIMFYFIHWPNSHSVSQVWKMTESMKTVQVELYTFSGLENSETSEMVYVKYICVWPRTMTTALFF